jgi:tetratricopeptide (TPR) repeat protein
MFDSGTIIDGRFQLGRRVGKGGMGEVYCARDRCTDQVVALKILSGTGERHLGRFAREAQLLARLRHPAIVAYLGDGTAAPRRPYLAMEWLDGEELATILKRGRLRAADALAVLGRVAGALAFAHARGVVHRDIKPSNLFVVGGQLAGLKLIDFGIAQDATGDGEETGLTQIGAALGTPGYMAPEQVRGTGDVGPAADVFALGSVLYECLTGRRAFGGEHAVAVQAKILLEDLPPVSEICPDVEPGLESLLQRMLSKDPADRPDDGAALAAEVEALTAEGAAAASVASGLSGGEQRLVSVLVAGPSGIDDDGGATVPDARFCDQDQVLSEALRATRAHVERLSDGTLVATMRGRGGGATDEAARTARVALEMRARLPPLAIALATGKALPTGRLPVGAAIDRAIDLLRRTAAIALAGDDDRPVYLDEVTAGLLETRFHIGATDDGHVLLGQREALSPARTLLGVPTPFVGRTRLLGHIEATIEECVDERAARALLVTAPVGMGKSRLAAELVRRLRDRARVRVWSAEGDVLATCSPHALFAGGVRRHLGISPEHTPARRHRTLRAGLARLFTGEDLDRVTAFLGEITGAPHLDPGQPMLVAARADPQLMADQIRRAAIDYLGALTRHDPVLILLDDLHWSDLPTVKLVDAALRELAERPLMVLGLARADIHARFPALWSGRAFEEVSLDGLPRSAQERLVRHVLAGVEPGQVSRLIDQSSGNPFCLEELVRAAASGCDEAPETVIAMVQTRLDGLSGESRRLLRAASIFGERFSAAGALALLGRTPDEGDRERLDSLVDAELIVPQASGIGEEPTYRFRHTLIREAAYASLTERDAALGHALAGEWLAERGEADPMVLASHFERGRKPASAVAWYRQAAQQALEANCFDVVAEATRRGIACGATGEDLSALRIAEMDALNWGAAYDRLLERAGELVASQPRGSASWYRAVRMMATAAMFLADQRTLVRLAEVLLSSPFDGDGDGAYACTKLFEGLRAIGEVELADRLLAHAETAVDRMPELARLSVKRYAARGTREVANWRSLSAAYAASGDLRRELQTRMNVAYNLIESGVYEEAEEILRECNAAAARLDIPVLIPHAESNLGYCLARQGRFAEAEPLVRRSIESYRGQGELRLVIGGHAHLAQAYLTAGRAADARREIAPIEEPSRGCLTSRPLVLAIAAMADIEVGRIEPARRAAAQAHELLEQLGFVEDGESLVRLAWAEALWWSGERPAARSAIADACGYLARRLAGLDRVEWRAAFRTRLWETARIVARAEEWGVAQTAASWAA